MDKYGKLDLSIYIPTYRRPGKVRTLKFMSQEAIRNTRLVVRPDEYEAYKKACPEMNILVLHHTVSNLSQTRNYILSTCRARYCMMLDDDLEFKYRPDLGKWNLKAMHDNSMFDDMTTRMVEKMQSDNLAHCAVSPVEGHSHYLAEWNYLQRYMRAYIFDLDVVNSVVPPKGSMGPDARFMYRDEVNGCEDFDMALQLIKAGYPSVVFYAYAQTHESSNAMGGLSEYRNIEYHNNAMAELNKLWPKHVRLVERETKQSWGGGKRIDVKVNWKKAFMDNNPEWQCRIGDETNTPYRKQEPVKL